MTAPHQEHSLGYGPKSQSTIIYPHPSQCHLYHRMVTLYRSDMRPGLALGAPPGHQRLDCQSDNRIYRYVTAPFMQLSYPGPLFLASITINRDTSPRLKLNFVLAENAFDLPLVNHPAVCDANKSPIAVFGIFESCALARKYVPDITFYFLLRRQHFFFSECLL